MRDYVVARVREIAEYIVGTGATVRQCAGRYGVSKTTVHRDMRERLPRVCPALAGPVGRAMRRNREDRHIRGGDATRRKYLKERDVRPHM